MRRQKEFDFWYREARDQEKQRHKEKELPDMAKLMADENVRASTRKRARRLLHPTEHHSYLELLAFENGEQEIFPGDSVSKKNEIIRRAAERADDGILILEKVLSEQDFAERLTKIKTFNGLRTVNSLNRLKYSRRYHLGLVRKVVEDMPTLTNNEGEKLEDDEKLELFAAVVGFAQTNLVNSEMKKTAKHARRDDVLAYGMQVLQLTRQESIIEQLYLAGKMKQNLSKAIK